MSTPKTPWEIAVERTTPINHLTCSRFSTTNPFSSSSPAIYVKFNARISRGLQHHQPSHNPSLHLQPLPSPHIHIRTRAPTPWHKWSCQTVTRCNRTSPPTHTLVIFFILSPSQSFDCFVSPPKLNPLTSLHTPKKNHYRILRFLSSSSFTKSHLARSNVTKSHHFSSKQAPSLFTIFSPKHPDHLFLVSLSLSLSSLHSLSSQPARTRILARSARREHTLHCIQRSSWSSLPPPDPHW